MAAIPRKIMRILLVNHGTAGDWGGGDGVQMRETAKRLAQRGHQAVVVNSDRPDVRGFDIVHLFNCRALASLEQQMQVCQAANVPVVVSPIWVSISRAIWGSRGSFGLLNQAIQAGVRDDTAGMKSLKKRKLAVQVADGFVQATGECDFDNHYQAIGELLNQADGLLPNSWLELQAVRSDLQWSGDCFEIAHYGVDPRKFLDADPEPFRQFSGIKTPFVLQAGRIEPAKNQAMLCWALCNTDLPIVLIGGSDHWPAYADLCRQISGDRLCVIDHIQQELLASAYAASAVHVLPTWMETCGLVTLEAALSGTPVVGSTFGHELEYLQQDCWYCDPADPQSIHRAVLAAIKAGRQHERPIKLKSRVLTDFNWEQAAEATDRLYRRVLTQRKR